MTDEIRETPEMLKLRSDLTLDLARGLRMSGGHQEITDYCKALEARAKEDLEKAHALLFD